MRRSARAWLTTAAIGALSALALALAATPASPAKQAPTCGAPPNRCERSLLAAVSDVSGKAAAANWVLQQLADKAPDNRWGRMIKSIASLTRGEDSLAEIRAIQAQLNVMQSQLFTLRTDVHQMNEDLLRTHLDTLQRGFAGPFVSDVAEAQKRFDDIADPHSRVSREARVNAFKHWMKETRIEYRLNQFEDLVGQPGGILDAANMVARGRDSDFVAYWLTWQAREVYDYYALVEADAVDEIVEYWHMIQGEDPRAPYNEEAYVDHFVADHTKRIHAQARRLKAPLPPFTLLQKRTGILWRFENASSFTYSGVTYYTTREYPMGYSPADQLASSPRVAGVGFDGRSWHFTLPSRADFEALVKEGVGMGPGRWLNQHGFPAWLFGAANNHREDSRRFWVNEPEHGGRATAWRIPYNDHSPGGPESTHAGALFQGLWKLHVDVGHYLY